ncbi:hypothetical protein HYPSUDRAFT_45281 [Hypholoma sublateritium FD-334 SS-4]|uniref:Uncharacterized protein n=1 Tax=Hypholoma sublateritium (strain FD-334 SS-4) TaxID=945553 RepID=A0A0D2M5D6_HYPSF|nr:hypothetical protein HYPSUDRAFT_45281 [Hypholoma sublateritium FD-334 SS-4]
MLRCRPRRRRPPLQLVRSGPIAVEVACKLNFVAVDANTEAKEEEKPATKEEDEDDVDEGEGENEDDSDSDSDSDEEDEDEEGEGEDDENKPKFPAMPRAPMHPPVAGNSTRPSRGRGRGH